MFATLICSLFLLASTQGVPTHQDKDGEIFPPIIIKGPEDQVVHETESVFLHCKVQGQPFPTVQWIKQDVRGEWVVVRLDQRISQKYGILKIQHTGHKDQTSYRCIARNAWGESSSNPAKIQVEGLRPESPYYSISLVKAEHLAAHVKYNENSLQDLPGCTVLPAPTVCSYQDLEYRTFNGSCNNLVNTNWGAAGTVDRRLIKPIYSDGFSKPRGAVADELINGYSLPSARLVSNIRLRARRTQYERTHTSLVMFWAQWLAHDIIDSAPATSRASFETGVSCNDSCIFSEPCFPILVPPKDPSFTEDCINFRRNSPACFAGTDLKYREQINDVTSYIDTSQVYGVSIEVSSLLMDSSTGELVTGEPSNFGGKPLLPTTDTGVPALCVQRSVPHKCFVAGDERVNQHISLTSIHVIHMREHNRLVHILRKINPHWKARTLFYEARKIIGAFNQIIHYRDYLPTQLGSVGMKKLGKYRGYNPSIDPSLSNSFVSSAFRAPHPSVDDVVNFLKDYKMKPETIPFDDSMLNPNLLREKGIDSLLMGMISTRNKMEKVHGSDLAASNIQRGRDHGLPPYVDFLKFCGIANIRTWRDLWPLIQDERILGELRDLYSTPANIDLVVGGFSEKLLEGARLGPTFLCLQVETFRRLREGDRFWFENHQFTSDQLSQLKKISFEKMLCDNADNIRYVPRDVFVYKENLNLVDCTSIPDIDLEPWRETV